MPRPPSLPELNFAVVGAKGAGKSTFIRCALDLKRPPSSPVASKKMSLEGEVFLISLIETNLEDVHVDETTILWPNNIRKEAGLPLVDGVLALYDVTEGETLSGIPSLLNACSKLKTPCVLVSCKCDVATKTSKSVDRKEVERTCMQETGIEACQTLQGKPETHKRCISVVLRNLISNNTDISALGRPRAMTATLTQNHIQQSAGLKQGHARASSDITAASKSGIADSPDQETSGINQNLVSYPPAHAEIPLEKPSAEEDRHIEMPGSPLKLDLSQTTTQSQSRIYAPLGTPTTIANSFLDIGPDSQDEEEFVNEDDHRPLYNQPESLHVDTQGTGYTFDELVDHLLARPMSKADSKFVLVFLCLYRKFTAPAQLLSAICARFESLSQNGEEPLIRLNSQFHHLSILAQWTAEYPGDFAHPVTRTQVMNFTNELAKNQLFAAAAAEVRTHLNAAQEDDDFQWLCSDSARGQISTIETFEAVPSMRSAVITMLSNPMEIPLDIEQTGPSTNFHRQTGHSKATSSVSSSSRPELGLSSLSPKALSMVGAAQQEAEQLTPMSRLTLSKPQWHQFMDFPDEDIAKELTRIDWIMFSAIRPRDLIRHVSLTPEQKHNCKSLEHVNRMINQFNHVAFWVANMVLLRDKAKHRARALEKFLGIAWRLRQLNNYNSLGAVIAGINGTAVHRLVQTRELVSPQTRRDFMRLEILMGTQRSHFAYRLAWENTLTEKIPFLPLHRRDLVSAEEGNRTFLPEDRINWKKFEIMGDAILGILKSQGTPFPPIQRNLDIQRLVLDANFSKDDDELYERSLQVEGPGVNEPRIKRFMFFQK